MEYEVTAEVDAPLETVWAVLRDVERWPEWTPTMTSVRVRDGGPLREGGLVRVRQPRVRPATWRVTALREDREPQVFTWETGVPGLRQVADHRLARRPDGTVLVTLSVRQSGLLGVLLGPVVNGLVRRYVDTELRSLKRRCETASTDAVR